MDTQTQEDLAGNLYELLEFQEDPQEIMDTIMEIDDLNRWNINITDYLRYEMDIDHFVIDVENPEQTHTAGPGGSFVPIPIDYGESILDFVIWLLIGGDNWELDFFTYPMADEIVRFLVINGAKSSPSLYLKWLSVEGEYEDQFEDLPEAFMKYKKIKRYLGFFNTVNRLKNVRNKNRKAKTIQRRVRGNRSRLYNSDLLISRYMRNVPGLKKGAWNIIDKGLREGEIESPDREIFKTEHFDPKWMSDREREKVGNRLMADYVDELNQYGGKNKKRTMRKKKKTIQVKKKKKRRMRGGAGTPDMDEGKLDIIIGQLNQIIDFTRPIEQRPSTYFQPPGGPAMAREQLDKHNKRVEQAFSAPLVPTLKNNRRSDYAGTNPVNIDYMKKFGPLQRAAFSQSLNPRLGVESSTQGIPIELYDKIISKIPTETNIQKGLNENRSATAEQFTALREKDQAALREKSDREIEGNRLMADYVDDY